MIGMFSLGSSCLRYVKTLKPALEESGFEVDVFQSTGMGGMAFEKLAAQAFRRWWPWARLIWWILQAGRIFRRSMQAGLS